MDFKSGQNGFSFTYSAKEQQEIKKIREKYTTEAHEDKMERVRRLDNKVTQKAQVISLIFGIIGALLLGFGMSLIMTELGMAMLGSKALAIVIGVLAGLAGATLVSFAYPMYNYVIRREREKIAPEIISLTDELLK